MSVRFDARMLGALSIVLSATCAAAQGGGPSMTREGSGTSWLPDSSPMYMLHLQKGAWLLMGHANVFAQYLHESGERGSSQPGSINWLMGMATRSLGHGNLGLRTMFSLEPWTIRGCGYPDLLASGEECQGEAIHDRQHPHDLAMEIAAQSNAPIRGNLRWQIYGGPVGEPALGPVAYPHRVSAMPNPIAPIAHHWLDSTHVSFGVVTGAVYGTRWKIESSAFNGREPDENRKDFDFGALDSMSARVWFLPTSNLALQVSGGHLNEAEPAENGGPGTDANRVTASATFHRLSASRVWATTLAWGRNSESGHGTAATLVETNLTLRDRDAWFGRFEVAQKTPHDLGLPDTRQAFTVSKLQGGYTRYVPVGATLKGGLGAAASASIVPDDLQAVYGRRVNPGVSVFLTLRPAETAIGTAGGNAPSGSAMVMVQTAFDPAKLACDAGFDPAAAPAAMFEGKTYYFCTVAERDRFLTDPRMSLSMMPPRQ